MKLWCWWCADGKAQHTLQQVALHGRGIVCPRSKVLQPHIYQLDCTGSGADQLGTLWIDHRRSHCRSHSQCKPHQHTTGDEFGLSEGLQ